MSRVGFIGLGHMGFPMAINLIKAGHEVTGFDLQTEALNALVSAGGIKAGALQDAARNQDFIITMLQTGEQMRNVCLSESGLFAAANPNTVFIDCSSIDVPSSNELHRQAQRLQLISVDAPVSGGVTGAVAATLTFMVGGTEHAFTHAKAILSCMGKKITWVCGLLH